MNMIVMSGLRAATIVTTAFCCLISEWNRHGFAQSADRIASHEQLSISLRRDGMPEKGIVAKEPADNPIQAAVRAFDADDTVAKANGLSDWLLSETTMEGRYGENFTAPWMSDETITGQETQNDAPQDQAEQSSPILSDPSDPENQLREIESMRLERNALIRNNLLRGFKASVAGDLDDLYNSTGLRIGYAVNTVYQGLTASLPDNPRYGWTTDHDLIFAWDVLDRGKPTAGKIYFHLEGRFDYDTRGPQNLGFISLGSAQGTANAFSGYDPNVIIRNFYWHHGSVDAGWFYRIGRITPDAILATSRYLSPVTTFFSNAGTGLFSSGYPDSGMGAVAGVLVTDRLGFLGLVSDAFANRFNFGEPGRGYFYTAGEIAFKPWPLTPNAGFSKLTFWKQPGGLAINAATGLPGWGMTLKVEQELTLDGRLVAIGRWGKSFSDASIWDQQMGMALVFNDPDLPGNLKDDALGIAFNWVKVNQETRDEYGIELFYRFPLFTDLDLTLAYQYVIDPANAVVPANPLTLTPETYLLSSGSAFSLRLRLTF